MAAPLEYEVREEYQSYSIGQLLDAPVSCFQGVGEIQSELLERYFNITTVRQLAEMPSFVEALAVQETVLEGGEMISRSVSEARQAGELEFHIRNSDQGKKISELPDSPIHVLDGVTPGQDLALYDAFRITNVTQMAQNRIMLEARIIEYLSREEGAEDAEGGDVDGALSSILGARAASSLAGQERAMSDEFADARMVKSADEVSEHVRSRVDAMRDRAQETPAPTREGALGTGETTADRLSSISESRGAGAARGADMDRIRGDGISRTDDILSSRTPAGAGRSAALSVANQRGAGGKEGDLAASRGTGSGADSVLSAHQNLGRGGPPPGGAQVRTRPSPTGATATATQAKPKQETTLPTEEEVTKEQVVEPTPPPPRTNPVPWIIAGVAALLVVVVGGYFLLAPEEKPVVKPPPPVPVKTDTVTEKPGTKPAGLQPSPEKPKGPVIQATRSVVKGDTLWRISIREYRDPLNWPSIFMENKNKIDNPDMIYPAQEFRIPANPEYRFPDYPRGYKRSR
ncbi:MAG: hypothetical protein V3S64_11380 [bacterium]